MLKLSRLINYPLGLLGLKLGRKPAKDTDPLKDIVSDTGFRQIYEKVKPYTLVGPERCYALYQSIRYILDNNIPGDFVECGVWKGGSAMLMAYTLLEAGHSDRKIILFDTFEGMVQPGEMDGAFEKQEWERLKKAEGGSNWCFSSEEEVRENMKATAYPGGNVILIRGKVENTLPAHSPERIALLRLDTDWYGSTLHELLHLYPLLEKKGVLMIDDYGAWEGARKATDEYFNSIGRVYLHRIDWTGRIVIK